MARVPKVMTRVPKTAVTLVDSAENCARAVKRLLETAHLSAPPERLGKLDVALTDATEGFLRTAAQALDLEISDVALRSVQSADFP
jgi:glutamate racemase